MGLYRAVLAPHNYFINIVIPSHAQPQSGEHARGIRFFLYSHCHPESRAFHRRREPALSVVEGDLARSSHTLTTLSFRALRSRKAASMRVGICFWAMLAPPTLVIPKACVLTSRRELALSAVEGAGTMTPTARI